VNNSAMPGLIAAFLKVDEKALGERRAFFADANQVPRD